MSRDSARTAAGEPTPRVLLLTPAFPPSRGGIERTAAAIAGGLDGHDLEVVAGRPQPSEVGMTPPPGLTVHWARNEPAYGRKATAALQAKALAVAARLRPEIVLCMHIRAMPAARVVQRLGAARVVVVVHAKEMREQPRLARAAMRWADAIVCASSFSRQLALDAGADPQRISVIHPGVTPPANTPAPLRERPGPPTVITVARMHDSHKGHDVALEALALLRARLPEVSWVMVGDGDLRPQLQRRAAALGVRDAVEFLGAVDDQALQRALSSAHAFCLLSREPPGRAAGEGFGIAFIEAGAHGLPVVAGRVPGVVDAVRDGVTGLLVDPRDPQRVAAALEQLLTDHELAARLGQAGEHRARELAWPGVVARYRTVLLDVLQTPPRAVASHGAIDLGWALDVFRGPRVAEPAEGLRV